MIYPLAELRDLSDEQIICEHDRIARTTSAGTDYYVAELNRRSFERATKAAAGLTSKSHTLTKWNMALSVIALMVAVVSLFVR